MRLFGLLGTSALLSKEPLSNCRSSFILFIGTASLWWTSDRQFTGSESLSRDSDLTPIGAVLTWFTSIRPTKLSVSGT